MLRKILDIFYPRCCPVCQKILKDQRRMICPECEKKLDRLDIRDVTNAENP